MSRMLISVLFAAGLLALAPSSVHGQVEGARGAEDADGRRYLDYYVSRFRLASSPGGEAEADAVGGRLMWSVAPLIRALPGEWESRTLVGGYLTHAPDDTDRMEILRYGAQVDYFVTSAPMGGRVEPLLSLAAGAVRVTESAVHWASVPYLVLDGEGEGGMRGTPLLRASLPERVSTSASVTPGVGARIRLLPGLSFRTDARQVIDFRDGVTANLELSGGISVGR